MNRANKTSVTTSPSDSFFGVALAQAFLGAAFGPAIDHIWDAGEMCSAVYEERVASKRTNGRSVYELGVRGTLAGTFTRNTREKNPLLQFFTAESFLRPSGTPALAF